MGSRRSTDSVDSFRKASEAELAGGIGPVPFSVPGRQLLLTLLIVSMSCDRPPPIDRIDHLAVQELSTGYDLVVMSDGSGHMSRDAGPAGEFIRFPAGSVPFADVYPKLWKATKAPQVAGSRVFYVSFFERGKREAKGMPIDDVQLVRRIFNMAVDCAPDSEVKRQLQQRMTEDGLR